MLAASTSAVRAPRGGRVGLLLLLEVWRATYERGALPARYFTALVRDGLIGFGNHGLSGVHGGGVFGRRHHTAANFRKASTPCLSTKAAFCARRHP